MSALAPYRPEAVLTAARAIDSNSDRARVLTALAPHLPAQERSLVLEEALTATRAIDDNYYRVQTLVALMLHVRSLSRLSLYSLWCSTLHGSSTASRGNLMRDLSTLMPFIEEFGQTRALEYTFRSVQDVTNWWR